MRILVVHNRYRNRGGEDVVFEAEVEMLRSRGHEVETYVDSNQRLDTMSKVSALLSTFWAREAREAINELIRRFSPDVAHFHNTFPLISASAIHACWVAEVPVVQTLHNYRLVCPGGYLLRDGKVCELCLNKVLAWRAVRYRCYRGSRTQSAGVALMNGLHTQFGGYYQKVSRFIALTSFSRKLFVRAGLPESKVVVKPNFVPTGKLPEPKGADGAVYVGRLSNEKGLHVMMEAWNEIDDCPLLIIGEGPMEQELRDWIARRERANVTLLGQVSKQEVLAAIRGSRFLVFPSVWYETFGLTMIEALSCSTPVICSNDGTGGEIIHDGETGLHFTLGDPVSLRAKVRWANQHPEEIRDMGRRGRSRYEDDYTEEANYSRLLDIYHDAQRDTAEKR